MRWDRRVDWKDNCQQKEHACHHAQVESGSLVSPGPRVTIAQ
jgi:hypothetical protein